MVVAVPARLGALPVLIAIHFLAGFLTGSIFRVRTLLGLVIIVLIECAVTAAMSGFQAGVWSLTSLVAVQMGYLGGVYARSILEKVGLLSRTREPHQAHPVVTTRSAYWLILVVTGLSGVPLRAVRLSQVGAYYREIDRVDLRNRAVKECLAFDGARSVGGQ